MVKENEPDVSNPTRLTGPFTPFVRQLRDERAAFMEASVLESSEKKGKLSSTAAVRRASTRRYQPR